MSDEAACKHHEMTQHFAFHRRIFTGWCIFRCTPWHMPGWLHVPIERDHCDDRGPTASVRERPRGEEALESRSTSQSHSHTLHRHNPLADPRPHKTLPSCEIKVEAYNHVTGWLGELNSILTCGLITLYLLCRIPHQSGSLFLIITPPFLESHIHIISATSKHLSNAFFLVERIRWSASGRQYHG